MTSRSMCAYNIIIFYRQSSKFTRATLLRDLTVFNCIIYKRRTTETPITAASKKRYYIIYIVQVRCRTFLFGRARFNDYDDGDYTVAHAIAAIRSPTTYPPTHLPTNPEVPLYDRKQVTSTPEIAAINFRKNISLRSRRSEFRFQISVDRPSRCFVTT